MDDAVKQQLVKFLETLNTGVEKGGDFVLEQAPLVAQEIVTYGRAWNTGLAIVLAITPLVILLFALRYARRVLAWTEGNCDRQFGVFFPMVFVAVGMAGMLIGACCECEKACRAWFMPRVYLVQEVAQLIKDVK